MSHAAVHDSEKHQPCKNENLKEEKNQNLTALVTGASSGLGEAMSRLLAEKGHGLVLVSENAAELNRVRLSIKQYHPVKIEIIPADLTMQDSADKVYKTCSEKNIRVDVLVNCAGIYANTEIEIKDPRRAEDLLNIHVISLTKLCFLFGRDMIVRRAGFILNVASITAFFTDPASLTYGPSKNYIYSFSRALHCDWKEHNVKVTCALPGGIATNFFQTNEVFIPGILRKILLTPERCAAICLNALFKGKRYVIPGIAGKLQALGFWIIARPIFYRFVRRIYFSLKKSAP